MPTIPTYIKTSDLAKYLEIQASGKGAWSEFIHNALKLKDMKHVADNVEVKPETPKDKLFMVDEKKFVIKTPKDAEKVVTDKINLNAKEKWQGSNFKKGKK